jgi:hypothetical protein
MKTLSKQSTHIGKVRESDLTTTEQVQKVLEWTHEQYCNHQYEEYESFLARENIEHPVICQELRYSEIFRGFWINEWTLRNQQEFLPFALDCEMDVAYITDEYLFINNHKRLINDHFFMDKYEYMLNLILKQ